MADNNNIEVGFKAQQRILELMQQQYIGTEYSAEGSSQYEDQMMKFDIKIKKGGKVVDKIDVKTNIGTSDRISYTVINQNGESSKAYKGDTSVRLGFVFNGSSVMYLVDMADFVDYIHSAELQAGRTVVKKTQDATSTYPNIITSDNSVMTAWSYYQVHRDDNGPLEGINYYAVHKNKLVPLYKSYSPSTGVRSMYFENGSKYVWVTKDALENMCKHGNGQIIDCRTQKVVPLCDIKQEDGIDLSAI